MSIWSGLVALGRKKTWTKTELWLSGRKELCTEWFHLCCQCSYSIFFLLSQACLFITAGFFLFCLVFFSVKQKCRPPLRVDIYRIWIKPLMGKLFLSLPVQLGMSFLKQAISFRLKYGEFPLKGMTLEKLLRLARKKDTSMNATSSFFSLSPWQYQRETEWLVFTVSTPTSRCVFIGFNIMLIHPAQLIQLLSAISV